MRRLLALVLGALVALLVAAPAAAQTTTGSALETAVEALRRDPVYVDPDAEPTITDAQAEALRNRVVELERPVFIAILSPAALDEVRSPDELPVALGRAVGLTGTYGVVAGRSFRAASNALPAGVASSAATFAVQEHGQQGLFAILDGFVERLAAAGTGAGSGRGDGATEGPFSPGRRTNPEPVSEGSDGVLTVLAVGAVGAGGYLWIRNRRRRREEEQEIVAAREQLRPELSVLADDVLLLEPEVVTTPEARADYDAAVSRYRAAEAAIGGIRTIDDADRVRRVLSEGRYAMARARARIEGREPPLPPDDLRRPGRHAEPAIDLDERREPVYVNYPGGFYGGGWFGGGGLLTGLMLGQMLGGFGGMGGGWGWGGGDGDHRGGGGFGGFGGDIGGGDFGGFGGGDVGGGDF